MNGKEFIKRASKYGKSHGLLVRVEKSRGKGGHQTLHVGEKMTIVQSGEIATGTFHAMLKQLEIPKDGF